MSETTFNPAVIEMRDAQIVSLRDPALTVVADVNWSVLSGDFWVVAGQQHSGKSDLLLHAAGLLTPTRGACVRFGLAPAHSEELALAERQRVGFVFAGGKLFNHLTLAENIALPLRYQKNLSAVEAASAVQTWLELFELTPWVEAFPSSVAVNWRLRAALARALILEPELLLLDNPLTGLGGRHRQWLLNLLEQLNNGHPILRGQKLTIVATSDSLRPWRAAQRKYAVLDEKNFSVIGEWEDVAQANELRVKELLADADNAII